MNHRAARQIEVTADALTDIKGAARTALPNETGGILLGWRTAGGLHIARAAEVLDIDATTHGYQRNFAAAQELLRSTLAKQPSDSLLGYIGEWHSHPAPVGASNADLRWIRRLARDLRGPIALIVASHTTDTWHLTGHLAGRFRTRPATIKGHP